MNVQTENDIKENTNVTITEMFNSSSFSDLAHQIDENVLQLDTVKAFLDIASLSGALDTNLEQLKFDLDASILKFKSLIENI